MRRNRPNWTRPLCLIHLAALAVLATADRRCAGQEIKVNPKVTASVSSTSPDAQGKQTVTLRLQIEKDWYVYANPVQNPKDDYQKNQTTVRVRAQAKLADVKVLFPAGKPHESFGDKYMIYEDKATIQIVVQRIAGDASPLEIDLLVHTCHKKNYCLVPVEKRITIP
jgi:Disulphide bond corrector protein DsbC